MGFTSPKINKGFSFTHSTRLQCKHGFVNAQQHIGHKHTNLSHNENSHIIQHIIQFFFLKYSRKGKGEVSYPQEILWFTVLLTGR